MLADLPRHTNLLLLLRLVCELLATVLVAQAVIGWLGAALDRGRASPSRSWSSSRTCWSASGRARSAGSTRTGWRWRRPGSVHGLARVLGPLASLLILIGNAITPGRGFREGPFATEAELRELVDLAEQRGVVEHGERDMIHSVFELGDTIAREVMVPRTDVVWIERGKSVRQALALALRSGFSRIPVVGDNVDDVVGIVYLKDLAARAQDHAGPRRPRSRRSCGRRRSCRSPSRWTSCCGRCRPGARTWPS